MRSELVDHEITKSSARFSLVGISALILLVVQQKGHVENVLHLSCGEFFTTFNNSGLLRMSKRCLTSCSCEICLYHLHC